MQPLVSGPSREWAVAAVAQRRSQSEIEGILDRAIAAALDQMDLPRAVELGLIKDYTLYFNTDELGAEVLDDLLFPQLLVEQDRDLDSRLLSSLDELTDGAVSQLAEAESRFGNSQIVDLCFQMLNHRLQYPPPRDRDRARSWEDQVTPILTVAAMPGGPDPKRILRFCVRNRPHGHTRTMLAIYSAQLRWRSNVDGLRRSLSTELRHGDDAGQDMGESGSLQVEEDESADLVRHAALLGLEQELDLSDLLVDRSNAGDPFALIYSRFREGIENSQRSASFPSTEVLRLKHYHHLERADDIVDFFYRSFFGFLANTLLGHERDNLQWLDSVGESAWQYRYLRHLYQVAKQAAGMLSAAAAPTLGWFYSELGLLIKPIWRVDSDDTTFSYGVAAANAAMDIGFDLLSIAQGIGAEFRISEADLDTVLNSDWCVPLTWLARYVERRRAIMTEQAVRWLLDREESELVKTIEPFPERSEHYCCLASIAALHGIHGEADALIHAVADNLVTHGNHKDVLFHQLFDTILAYHEAAPNIEPPQAKTTPTAKWVISLAPAIAAVEKYTDGDETGELPRRLADLLAKVAGDLLPAYFEWLTHREEHYDALHAFHVLLRSVDLSSAIYLAVAQTGVDRESLSILDERSRLGDHHARSALRSLLQLLGESALQPVVQKDESERVLADAGQKSLPNPADFEPSLLSDYVSALAAQHDVYSEEHICDWIDCWVKAGRKADVLAALEEAHERGVETRVSDRMFALSLELRGREKAYHWLVQAQIESHGWRSYWTAADKARERWKIVKARYPERWFEFLQDTIHDRGSRGSIAVGHGTFERMVEYCLFMDQLDMARGIVERTISLALQLVSPLSLPVPEWSLAE